MVTRQILRWFATADGDFPSSGGTKAVLYHGDTAWMYWNPESRTWHPLNGWRKNLGQPATDVVAWAELPPPPR